jgi:protein-tyrosine-phosphatase
VLLMRLAGEDEFNVLFLCTGNSARSILAEALMNELGKGRFRGYSAGSHPTGRVNRFALEQLERARLPTTGYRSKSWNEFAASGAPFMHFVFTVCDSAAAEVCPVWPGKPITAHWGVPDPAAVEGTDEDKRRAFNAVFLTLKQRISLFVALPFDKLEGLALEERLDRIGRAGADASAA